MTMKKMLGLSTLAAAALALAIPTMASAAPHHRPHGRPHMVKVCKWERHHGHKTRVCRMVRR